MPTIMVDGQEIEVDEGGFFVHPDQWTEEMAPELARTAGVGELNEEHRRVIKFMREEYFAKGTGPTVRALGLSSGVPVKRLYELFPKGPAKLAARIAGIPKPRGCI